MGRPSSVTARRWSWRGPYPRTSVRRSWSNRFKAKEVTSSRPTVSSRPCAGCATSTASCSSSTKSRAEWAAPGSGGRWRTGAWNRTLSAPPKGSPPACPWGPPSPAPAAWIGRRAPPATRMEGNRRGRRGAHGNTYGGTPLACVAASATIDLIEDGMMQNALEQGSFALDALAEMQCRHPSIGHVRGKGLMLGVEFVKDRQTKGQAPKLRDRILDRAFGHGLLLLGCGESAIRVSPALNIPRRQLDEGLPIPDTALRGAGG